MSKTLRFVALLALSLGIAPSCFAFLFTPDFIAQNGAPSHIYMEPMSRAIAKAPAYFVGGGLCFIDSFWMADCLMSVKVTVEGGTLILTKGRRLKSSAPDPDKDFKGEKGEPTIQRQEVQAVAIENGRQVGAHGDYMRTSVTFLLKNGTEAFFGNSEDGQSLSTSYGDVLLTPVDAAAYDAFLARLQGQEAPLEVLKDAAPIPAARLLLIHKHK